MYMKPPLECGHVLEAKSSKKTDSPFPKRHQLSLASELGYRLISPPSSMMKYLLALLAQCLCEGNHGFCEVMSTRFYYVQNILFYSDLPPHLVLRSLSLFHNGF